MVHIHQRWGDGMRPFQEMHGRAQVLDGNDFEALDHRRLGGSVDRHQQTGLAGGLGPGGRWAARHSRKNGLGDACELRRAADLSLTVKSETSCG